MICAVIELSFFVVWWCPLLTCMSVALPFKSSEFLQPYNFLSGWKQRKKHFALLSTRPYRSRPNVEHLNCGPRPHCCFVLSQHRKPWQMVGLVTATVYRIALFHRGEDLLFDASQLACCIVCSMTHSLAGPIKFRAQAWPPTFTQSNVSLF